MAKVLEKELLRALVFSSILHILKIAISDCLNCFERFLGEKVQ
jgi:hypothetical protein